MNPPESNDPWEKHYATRGLTRPPMMQVSAKGEVVVPPEQTATKNPRPAAAPAELPRPASASPLPRPASNPSGPQGPLPKVTWETNSQFEFTNEVAMRRAAEAAEAAKRKEALRVWRIVGGAVLAVLLIGLANEVGAAFLRAAPSAGHVAASVDDIGRQITQLYDKPAQPLVLESARPVVFEYSTARRADYDVVTTLRLRAELYAPAESNGAQPYLQLQRSLAEARAKVLKHSLFSTVPTLRDAPEMPRLLVVTHHAGEKLVVKVPLSATRSGWSWTLAPVKLEQRRAHRPLHGEVIARFSETPFIVFNRGSARDIMLQKMQDARRYIIAVNGEMVNRGLTE